MRLQEALQSAGGFGRYQVIHIICILVTCNAPVIWNNLSIVFQGYGNSHHCVVGRNVSKTEMIPTEIGPDGSERLSQCEIYTYPGSNVTQPCPAGWEYDKEYFDEKGTLTMEWDLVCEKKSYVEIAITIRTVGSAVGSAIMGSLGDMLGRRKALFIALLLLNILSIGAAFSPNYVIFSVLIFFRGFVRSGMLTNGIVLASELCPRTVYAVALPFLGLASAFSQMTLVLFAYFLRDWRQLQLGVSGVSCVLLLYYRWCPESVRWYISKGKISEAKLMMQRQAKMNHCTFREEIFSEKKTIQTEVKTKVQNICTPQNGCNNAVNISLPQEKNLSINNQHGINIEKVVSGDLTEREHKLKLKISNLSQWKIVKEFIKTPRLLAIVGVLSYFSFVQRFNQFGLHLLQSNTSGNIYIKFIVNAASGIPGTFLAVFMIRRFGRKISAQVFLCLCALHFVLSSIFAYLASGGMSKASDASTWLAVTAKPYIIAQTTTIVVFAQELSPTSLRSTSMSFQAAFGFTGTILAPFVAISVTRISTWLPSALFAGFTLVSVFLTQFLPETLGRGLPTSTEQIVNYPLNLTKEERQAVRDTHKRETLFGQVNKGFVIEENVQNTQNDKSEETTESTYL